MKRRRGRRGFWWWSWLLALITIAGVVGGYKYGEKKWEEAPKDYLGIATVSFRVRDPFISKKAGVDIPSSTLADANELEVLRVIKSEEELAKVAEELGLADKWEMGTGGAVNRLREGLDFDLNKETNELQIQMVLHDPEAVAEVANFLAENLPEVIKELDEKNKATAYELLEAETRPFQDLESDAKAVLQEKLDAKGIRIKVTPDVDLGAYQEFKEILTAKVEWDSVREDLEDLKDEQLEYRSYWQRPLLLTKVIEKAQVPQGFVGPSVKPFQMRWLTYGLTAGMILGSLVTLLFWKLFP